MLKKIKRNKKIENFYSVKYLINYKMEGTCGKLKDETNGIVRKILKKNYRGTSAMQQFYLQKLAYDIVINNKLQIISIPKVFDYNENSYTMEKIDDSKPYYTEDSSLNNDFKKELLIFYKEFEKQKYFPNDFECFIQKDGKISIVDFDKFIKIQENQNINKQLYLKNPFIPMSFYL